jgi:hypothetical protein
MKGGICDVIFLRVSCVVWCVCGGLMLVSRCFSSWWGLALGMYTRTHAHTHNIPTHLRIDPGPARLHGVPHHERARNDAEEQQIGPHVVQGEVRVGQGQAGGDVGLVF